MEKRHSLPEETKNNLKIIEIPTKEAAVEIPNEKLSRGEIPIEELKTNEKEPLNPEQKELAELREKIENLPDKDKTDKPEQPYKEQEALTTEPDNIRINNNKVEKFWNSICYPSQENFFSDSVKLSGALLASSVVPNPVILGLTAAYSGYVLFEGLNIHRNRKRYGEFLVTILSQADSSLDKHQEEKNKKCLELHLGNDKKLKSEKGQGKKGVLRIYEKTLRGLAELQKNLQKNNSDDISYLTAYSDIASILERVGFEKVEGQSKGVILNTVYKLSDALRKRTMGKTVKREKETYIMSREEFVKTNAIEDELQRIGELLKK